MRIKAPTVYEAAAASAWDAIAVSSGRTQLQPAKRLLTS
jgi:hypothetical protein